MAAKIEWRSDGTRWAKPHSLQEELAGSAPPVTERLLDDGWRVVVPWIVEARARAGRSERDGLELVKADLFDPAGVADAVALAASDGDAPLRGVVNLVGGFQAGKRVHETPIDDFERQFTLNLRATYLVTQASAAAPDRGRRRVDRLRRHARGAGAVLGRRRLRRRRRPP